MLWQQVPMRQVLPKYYLNGFPKSGLHLVALMISPLIRPMPPGDLRKNEWVGTFTNHSWTLNRTDLSPQLYCLAGVEPGHYMKGHAGYVEEFEQLMRYAAIAHVFVYRDLRDVAVSQAHHWVSANERQHRHEDKGFFRKMEFADVLAAVIEGLGPYPSIFDRWAEYAPWLEKDDVLALRFEELRSDPADGARRIVEHGVKTLAQATKVGLRVDPEAGQRVVDRMVEASQQTHLSPTYRKGDTGGWRDEFDDRHVELFKRCDIGDWLVQLGYEEDGGW